MKNVLCLIQFQDNVQPPQGKHNRCKSVAVSTQISFHGRKCHAMGVTVARHSMCMFISVVDRKV